MDKSDFIYFRCNTYHNVLSVGVTNRLITRVAAHKAIKEDSKGIAGQARNDERNECVMLKRTKPAMTKGTSV